jgi:hypothetical protein
VFFNFFLFNTALLLELTVTRDNENASVGMLFPSDTVGVAGESREVLNCAVTSVLNGHFTMDIDENCHESQGSENDAPAEQVTDLTGTSNQDKTKQRQEDISVFLSQLHS